MDVRDRYNHRQVDGCMERVTAGKVHREMYG